MQQINLYLPELRPKKEWLTASTFVFSCVGFLAMMVLFSVVGKSNLKTLEADVINLENQLVAARNQVEQIKSKAKPYNVGQLDQKIQQLKADIASFEHVGRIIEFQNLGNSDGFSDALDTLAQHSMTSIALDRFSLSQNGRYLEMQGVTREPKDIAVYIEKLSQEPAFGNTRFGLLTVKESRDKGITHKFALGFTPLYEVARNKNEQ